MNRDMKREILFRAQMVCTKDWVYGHYFTETGRGVAGSNDTIVYFVKDKFGTHPVTPEIVGQFIGLIDKNGVKIFEEDIVKYYQPYSKKWETHIVLWDNKWAGFGLFEQGNEWCIESDWMKIKEIEVIGTIHDNPKLINK